MTLNSKNLAYYNESSNKWIVESIEYEIFVGGSSKDEDLLKVYFKIEK